MKKLKFFIRKMSGQKNQNYEKNEKKIYEAHKSHLTQQIILHRDIEIYQHTRFIEKIK